MTNAARKIDTMSALISYVSNIMGKKTGNTLGPDQRSMVENRLKGRMLELQLTTPDQYQIYLESNYDSESKFLVGLMTTHHTFFFREFVHFDYLKKALPDLVEDVQDRGDDTLYIWSSACSKGQEVYSLAMFLDHHLPFINSKIKYKILGSDIDPVSIKFAENGVYYRREIKEVPLSYLKGHWVRGKGEISEFVKAKNSIREHCEFQVMNLLDLESTGPKQKFDIILCRNVLIYFTPDKVNKIINSLKGKLYSSGQLITGVSESLVPTEFDLHLKGPNVYGLKDSISTKPRVVAEVAPTSVKQPVIKVLCVDDSKSILKLLGRIFEGEEFEVVAVASNGIEAHEALKKHDVDVMT